MNIYEWIPWKQNAQKVFSPLCLHLLSCCILCWSGPVSSSAARINHLFMWFRLNLDLCFSGRAYAFSSKVPDLLFCWCRAATPRAETYLFLPRAKETKYGCPPNSKILVLRIRIWPSTQPHPPFYSILAIPHHTQIDSFDVGLGDGCLIEYFL